MLPFIDCSDDEYSYEQEHDGHAEQARCDEYIDLYKLTAFEKIHLFGVFYAWICVGT